MPQDQYASGPGSTLICSSGAQRPLPIWAVIRDFTRFPLFSSAVMYSPDPHRSFLPSKLTGIAPKARKYLDSRPVMDASSGDFQVL
jgi:hypothetical protein